MLSLGDHLVADGLGGRARTPGQLQHRRSRHGAAHRRGARAVRRDRRAVAGLLRLPASSLGYDVSIEKPGQFHCDDGKCVGDDIFEGYFKCDDDACVGDDAGLRDGTTVDPDRSDIVTCLEDFVLDTDPDPGTTDDELSDETVWKFWSVHVSRLGDTWFTCDEGECDADPLEGFPPAPDLGCVFRRLCPPHTQLVFNYSGTLLPNALLTQDGMPIGTEDGAVLVAN